MDTNREDGNPKVSELNKNGNVIKQIEHINLLSALGEHKDVDVELWMMLNVRGKLYHRQTDTRFDWKG